MITEAKIKFYRWMKRIRNTHIDNKKSMGEAFQKIDKHDKNINS